MHRTHSRPAGSTRPTRARLLVALLLGMTLLGPAVSGEDNGVHALATMSADPAINSAGWARSDVTVTLACSSQTANCQIEYRLGDAAAILYTGPFVVSTSGDHTLTTTTSPNRGIAPTTDTFRVRVDKVAPIIGEHAGVVAQKSGETTIVHYANPSATDALSGLASLGCAPASGSAFPDGTTLVTCTATDVAGNSATPRTFTVQVTTRESERLVGPDVVAEATSANGAVVLFDHQDCEPASGTRFPLGATSVTCPQTAFTVRVVDTTPPTIASPANITAEATSSLGAIVLYTAPATSDLVDGAGVSSCAPGSGAQFALGDTTVTCGATDARGNAASSRTFRVSVLDTTPPLIDPVSNLSLAATDPDGARATYPLSAQDKVDGSRAVTCDPPSGSTFARGVTTVTCKSSDTRGNLATSTFTVNVSDSTAPVIAPHADVTSEATSALGATVVYDPPTYTDDSGGGTATCTPTSGSTFPLGVTNVSCQAVDTSGNSATSSFLVTVVDTTAPTLAIALDPATANGDNGWYTSFVNASISATDHGAGVNASSIAHSFDGVHWTNGTNIVGLPQGHTTLHARASDNAGNSATTSRVVKIDSAPPTAPAGVDFVAEAASASGAFVNFTAPIWSDGTSGVANDATCSPALGSLFALGTTSVLCTARDNAGNLGRWTLTVTVLDTSAPTVAIALDPPTPQGIEGWYTSGVNATIVVNDSASGVNASSIEHSLDGANWTSGATIVGLPQGQTTLFARASDVAGNKGNATRLVKIDTIAPIVTGTMALRDRHTAHIFFNFSEAMDRNSTQAALVNASGWNASWNNASTQLSLSKDLTSYGIFTLTLGPGAKDAHGVAFTGKASQSVENPEPPAPPAPPEAPVALAATLTDGRVRLGWSAPENDHGAPVTSYRIRVNGGEPVTLSGTYYDVPALARGAVHSFSVTALNSAGESPAATIELALPPRSTLSAPPPTSGGWHTSPPTIAFATDPAGAPIFYDIGQGQTSYDGPFVLADGRSVLRWHASAGGVDEEAREAAFQVDTAPPSISGASATGGDALTIRASVGDATSGVVAVHAIATLAGGEPVLVALWPSGGGVFESHVGAPPGEYAIVIVANDAAGHEARASAGSAVVLAPVVPLPTPVEPQIFFPESGGDIPLESTGTRPSATDDAAPTSQPTEEPAPPEPTFVIDGIDAGARGVIVIRLTGVENVERVRFVLVDQEGFDTQLAAGTPDLAWDTTTVSDGYYTLEARRARAPADPGQLSIQSSHEVTLVSARVLVRNEFAAPVAAAGVVVGAVLVSAATQTALSAAAGGATSSIGSAAGGFDPFGFAQEVAIDAGQDKLKSKTLERDRKRRIRSLIAAGISLAILAPLWAFSETEGWSATAWMPLVPIVGAAAVIVMTLKYAIESALADATGARPRVRLWLAGAISLVVSSVLFRNPFGYPAYVDEEDESEARSTWRMQGLRALATIAGSAAFMLPFLALSSVLPWSFIGIGLLLATTNVATAAIPFGPLPGRDVWRWNKWIAIGVALAGFALYVGFAAALAPVWALWTIALSGGVAYAYALLRFRRTIRAKAVRVPVQVPVGVRTEDAAAPPAEGASVSVRGHPRVAQYESERKTRPPKKKGRRDQ